jgi:hypothetical protein
MALGAQAPCRAQPHLVLPPCSLSSMAAVVARAPALRLPPGLQPASWPRAALARATVAPIRPSCHRPPSSSSDCALFPALGVPAIAASPLLDAPPHVVNSPRSPPSASSSPWRSAPIPHGPWRVPSLPATVPGRTTAATRRPSRFSSISSPWSSPRPCVRVHRPSLFSPWSDNLVDAAIWWLPYLRSPVLEPCRQPPCLRPTVIPMTATPSFPAWPCPAARSLAPRHGHSFLSLSAKSPHLANAS